MNYFHIHVNGVYFIKMDVNSFTKKKKTGHRLFDYCFFVLVTSSESLLYQLSHLTNVLF